MRLRIQHETKYSYDDPVSYAMQQVRLTPKDRAGQSIIHWETSVEGGTKELSYDDQHNNFVELILFEPGQTEITIRSEGQVEISDNNGLVGPHGGFAPLWYFKKSTALTKPGKHTRQLVKSLKEQENSVSTLHALSAAIRDAVAYKTGTTGATTTAEDAMENELGVCQDHAHIFITAARLMNYPARYVSGYLMMDDRIEQDATHAWAEAYVAELGWVGFDISNGISPDARYVRIATGLDYSEASPISGMRFGGSNDEKLLVSLQVQQ